MTADEAKEKIAEELNDQKEGSFKFETCAASIDEILSIAAKQYSFNAEDVGAYNLDPDYLRQVGISDENIRKKKYKWKDVMPKMKISAVKSKGVPSNVVKSQITQKDFLDILFGLNKEKRVQVKNQIRNIREKDDKGGYKTGYVTMNSEKRAIIDFNDKSYWPEFMGVQLTCLKYGHHLIDKIENGDDEAFEEFLEVTRFSDIIETYVDLQDRKKNN